VLAKAGKQQHAGVLGRLPPLSMPPHVAPKCAATAARMGLANGSAALLPSPALGERCHRSLARRLVSVASAIGSSRRPFRRLPQ
jgi:hypothetical protein